MRKALLFLPLILGFISPSASPETWKHYIPGNTISDMAVWGDSVWCATSGSVVRWSMRDGTYVQYTKRDGLAIDTMSNIRRVLVDRNGAPWFAGWTDRPVIFRFDGGSSLVYSTKDHDIPNSNYISSFKDRRGNLWFGSTGDGVGRFDGSAWKTFRPPKAIADVSAVVQDRRGTTWFAANGLWKYDGENVERCTIPGYPEDIMVQSIALDTNGAVWFGTTKGLSRFDGDSWKIFTASDGLAGNDVSIVVSDRKGGIWIAASGGVSHFDGVMWKSFREENGLITSKVTGIAPAADGTVWFSHGRANMGVTVYDGEKMTWYTIFNTSIPTNDVRTVASGPDGVVWCVIDSGVMSWDGKNWRKYGVADGLKLDTVSGITVDELDRKWFFYPYTKRAGVTCLDGDSWKTYTREDGLGSDAVLAICARKDGVTWFAGKEGVSRFDGTVWDHFPKNDRLLSGGIHDIAEGNDGVIWLATLKGLTRFDGTSWWTYTAADGLPKDQVDRVRCAPDGTPWVLCDGTLLHLEGAAFRAFPIPVDAGLSEGYRYRVYTMDWDENGVLWTGASRVLSETDGKPVYGGLWCLRDGRWVEDRTFSPQGNLSLITFDGSGSLLFTDGIGLKRYDGASVREFRVDGPESSFSQSGICDRENRLWFFGGEEAVSFDGTAWRTVAGKPGEFIIIQNVSLDNENTIWYNSLEGIYRFDGVTASPVISRGDYPVADPIIGPWARDGNGVFWAAFPEGKNHALYRFDGNAWNRIPEMEALSPGTIRQVRIDKAGVLWVTTDSTITWYDGKRWNHRDSPDASLFHFDEFNNAWFRTTDGITRFDGNEWKVMIDADNVPANHAILGMDNENHIWMRNFDTGIARYDGASWKFWTEADGLLNSIVLSMLVDKNNIKWFVTADGICSLDDRPGAGSGSLPAPVTLRGSYPNPFNAGTSIEFDLYSWSPVDLSIYNIAGQKVRTLIRDKMEAGRHVVPWNGLDDEGNRVSSGPYFYRIKNEGRLESGRMMLLK